MVGCGVSDTSKLPQAKKKQGHGTVHILAVNDMHANIDNFPRLAFIVDSLRKIDPKMLLVSAGDNHTGNPINDRYTPKGLPMITLMNALRFDFSAVGNHEFDTGKGFGTLTHKAKFDFICANVVPLKSSDTHIKPYKLIQMPNGLTLAFTSLLAINSQGIPDSHPLNVKNYQFFDPQTVAKRMLGLTSAADALIFVNHLGIEGDGPLAKALPKGKVPLIIGGHSHTLIDKELRVNGTLITQAGARLQYATWITLTVMPNGSTKTEAKLIPVGRDGKVKPDIKMMVDKYNDDPKMKEVVGKAETAFETKEQIGFLMADALKEHTGADITLVNPGGVRSNKLMPGMITMKDIYTIDPFDNDAMILSLTGQEIKDFYLTAWPRDDYMPLFGAGLFAYYILNNEGKLDDVELFLTPEVAPLEMNKHYKVAMNSYMVKAYPITKDKMAQNVGMKTADILAQYLRKIHITPDYDGITRVRTITRNPFIILKSKTDDATATVMAL